MLWLGLGEGLFKWVEGKALKVQVDHPAFDVRIEDLQQLPDSTIILGTKGEGVVFWKEGNLDQITVEQGLTSNMIERIHVDEKDQVWVATLNGLNKLRKEAGVWKVLSVWTTANGLPSNNVNMVKTRGEDVWVATDNGLVNFKDEARIKNPSDMPRIASVLVNNASVKDLQTAFSHKENNLQIHFLTLNYRMAGKIPYRYRLLPRQENWSASEQTVVNYPALLPGAYTFEVQSQNEDGVWSSSSTFAFTIKAPWWQRPWALAIWFFLAGGVVYGVYKFRTGQLKKELALQRQISEVERQALRSQMNPHFIFNSLNAIQSYIAKGDKLQANRYLSRFSRLIRSALEHARLTQIPLEEDIKRLRDYIELERMRFEGEFEYTIRVREDVDQELLDIPPLLIQPFVENAIIHGLANKKGKGYIDLDYRLVEGYLCITITDNGIGREASQKRKEGIESSHKSIGMTVTRRRLEMLTMEGKAGRVEVEDVTGDAGEVSGTRVRVWVPVG